MRDYQLAGRDELVSLYSQGHSRATLVLPCGTGETVVVSQLIPTTGQACTVMFVPTLALLHQTWLALHRDHPSVAMLGVCSPATPGQGAPSMIPIGIAGSAPWRLLLASCPPIPTPSPTG